MTEQKYQDARNKLGHSLYYFLAAQGEIDQTPGDIITDATALLAKLTKDPYFLDDNSSDYSVATDVFAVVDRLRSYANQLPEPRNKRRLQEVVCGLEKIVQYRKSLYKILQELELCPMEKRLERFIALFFKASLSLDAEGTTKLLRAMVAAI